MHHKISSSLSNYPAEQLIIALSSQPFVSAEYTCQMVIKGAHTVQGSVSIPGWNAETKL